MDGIVARSDTMSVNEVWTDAVGGGAVSDSADSHGTYDEAYNTEELSGIVASLSSAAEVPGGSTGPKESLGGVHTHAALEEKLEEQASVSVPALTFSDVVGGSAGPSDPDICAICLDRIKLAETSQIKGCEHSYCVTCILRWALYQNNTWCPQCRLPFTEMYVYRSLDGSLNDYLIEESVCLLLRASWFEGMPVFAQPEEPEDYYEDEEFDDYYFKSNVRIGNRRWGDNGYVRAGRREARPVGVRHLAAAVAQADEAGSSSFRPGKGKEKASPKEATGRRAKRAQKREALDKQLATQRSVR
ncbi:uncharacterized protein [Physcomitrium patens]|uniref:RING-type domain-containing protein n=1 Tax=Physcomitrium patens TaxID=3218 RepID=A0A2K1ID08_PHYPA|nr:uncharacterized protein LOC112277835 [Physcomitrium patens]PNR27163.1 hypothetical protein PHYPA_030644 [Physcomitrium patens]|eukprot:XP_024366387.1 uncharacterized protein LOC112277835 [Physcomitrella patens]